MGIKIKHLTKMYGNQKAVDNVSFEVNEGEIVGFLGPNGAGKSTTMKMITCFLSPTSGEVEVNGLNVLEHPMEIKKHVGYLPENNPLYEDLFVHEYLQMVGRLYGLSGTKLTDRVKEIISLTGLGKEQNKVIGNLSKGYKQRVGLAQALVHDPDVLVLDEPTTGLDPNQITEVRSLIKSISAEKTVILSTHIMQEVQAICDRAVIINNGTIAADSTINELQAGVTGEKKTRVQVSASLDIAKLEAIEGVVNVELVGEHTYVLTSDKDIRKEVSGKVLDEGLNILELSQMEDSLEDVFMRLTEARE